MTRKVRWIQALLALILLIFTLQTVTAALDRVSNLVLALMQSGIADFLFEAAEILVFIFLKLILAKIFIVQTLIVRPKFVQNMSNLFFFCGSVYILSLLALLFAELTPAMEAAMALEPLGYFGCATGFGMPAAEVFLMVALYNLYKFNFFRKRGFNEFPRFVNEQPEGFYDSLLSFEESAIEFCDCKYQILGAVLSFAGFKKLAVVALGVLALQNLSNATAFLRQIVLACVAGHTWAFLYFYFIQDKVKSLVHDLVLAPGSRRQTVSLFNWLCLGLLSALSLAFGLRKFFGGPPSERAAIILAMAPVCGPRLYFEDAELLSGLALLLPVFVVNLLFFTPDRPKLFSQRPERRNFFNLMSTEKLSRILIIGLPLLSLAVGFKWLQFLLLRHSTSILPLLLLLASCLLLLAVFVALVLPFAMYKRNLLLGQEYLFTDKDPGEGRKDPQNPGGPRSNTGSPGYEEFDEEIRPSDVEEEDRQFETPRESVIKHTRFFVKTPEEEARAKSEAGGGDEKGVAAEIGYVKFHTENKGALEMSELPRKQMEFSPHRNEPDVRVKPKEGKESPQVSDLQVPLHTEEGNGSNGFEVIPSPQSPEDNREHK